MLLKQANKARNTLKRITKFPWTFKDADDLERAHLLLTDVYIQVSVPTVALAAMWQSCAVGFVG